MLSKFFEKNARAPQTLTFKARADSPAGQRLLRLFNSLETAVQRPSGLRVQKRDSNDYAAAAMVDEIRQVFAREGVDVSGLDKILGDRTRPLTAAELMQAAIKDPVALRDIMREERG